MIQMNALIFLWALIIGFSFGYVYRSYKIKKQLIHPKEFEKIIESYGFSGKTFSTSYLFEIFLKAAIIIAVASALFFSVYSGMSEAMEIASKDYMLAFFSFSAGFFSGYVYRSYKLKFQLLSKEQYKKMLEGYGFLKEDQPHYLIDTAVKAVLLIIIFLIIYFSVYPM